MMMLVRRFQADEHELPLGVTALPTKPATPKQIASLYEEAKKLGGSSNERLDEYVDAANAEARSEEE